MGRAARRQQERADRRQRTQPPPRAIPSASPSPGAGGGQRGGSFFKPRWIMDIISELRKVTWPTRAETVHLTIVVIVVSLLFGVLLGGADLIFSWAVEQTILR